MSTWDAIATEAIRLATSGGAGFLVVVALVLLFAVLKVAAPGVAGALFPPYTPEPPPPSAEWGDNVKPADPDHPGGGMEGG